MRIAGLSRTDDRFTVGISTFRVQLCMYQVKQISTELFTYDFKVILMTSTDEIGCEK